MNTPQLLPAARTLARRAAILLGLGGGLFAPTAQAQSVPKTILVEHFTNTLCSVCASRNPSFYANLRQQTGVLHIAYHPSSPYRNCIFSQQNTAENDARTNFYGVYGSTPRLVLNGAALPASQNYAAASLFTPYQGQTSAFAVAASLRPVGADSIAATVQLTTRAAHSYTGLALYIALVEDTVFYAAPNGEPLQYNVFRKSFTGNNTLAIVPAAAVGGTVTITRKLRKEAIWTANRLYALAVVQAPTGPLVQAGISARFSTVLGTATATPAPVLRAFPNPTSGSLQLETSLDLRGANLTIFNVLGQPVRQVSLGSSAATLDVRTLNAGQYWLRLTTADGQRHAARFVKAE